MATSPTIWNLSGISFNGMDSQIVIPANPLAGARSFSIEARIKPAAGGETEQRFVHVQCDDESRALLELRSTDGGWYADVFVHFPDGERYLNDPDLIHPFGEWADVKLQYDGSHLRQFVNGHLELEGTLCPGQLGPGNVSIGMRLNKVSPFKGTISEVRFTPY